jgi:hypothetical protein
MRCPPSPIDPSDRLREIAAILATALRRRISSLKSAPSATNPLEDVPPDSLSDHAGFGRESGG